MPLEVTLKSNNSKIYINQHDVLYMQKTGTTDTLIHCLRGKGVYVYLVDEQVNDLWSQFSKGIVKLQVRGSSPASYLYINSRKINRFYNDSSNKSVIILNSFNSNEIVLDVEHNSAYVNIAIRMLPTTLTVADSDYDAYYATSNINSPLYGEQTGSISLVGQPLNNGLGTGNLIGVAVNHNGVNPINEYFQFNTDV
jgi:hypothetical protein